MSVLVDMSILTRTIRISWANNAGTAVYFEHYSRKFLVTAAHLVKGAASGDKLAIRREGKWQFIVIAAIHTSTEVDASIIVPATQWGEALPVERLNGAGMMIGEEVAFCGFPLGLEMEGVPKLTDGRPPL